MRYLITVLLLFGFSAVLVRADEGAVVIRNFTVIHSGNLSAEDEQFVIQQVKSHAYKSTALNEIGERVRFAFQQRGYFKVIVHDPVFTPVNKDTQSEIVNVSVKVDEGEIYRLKDITFTSNTVFTPAELRSQFPISDGDIFDREKIAKGLEGLRGIFVAKDYLNFTAVPETDINEKEHTVALVIDLDMGRQEGNASRQ